MSEEVVPVDVGSEARAWSPWRTVVAFGLVSLSADMVYEGMRSVAGPFLGTLGASALTVGIVTGAGEAVALMLRLVTGPLADQGQRHWRLAVIGYGMTAICVPLLAVTPLLGSAGVAVAASLILLERAGKAVRSPAKSTLLARMATGTGRGRGFAVHKALDQVGAFAGPLAVAGIAAVTGVLWSGLAFLAIPGLVTLLLLAQLRRRAPSVAEPDPEDDPPVVDPPVRPGLWSTVVGAGLPRDFHLFSLAAALATAGLMTFGVISYRFVEAGLISLAAAPLVYAMAMAVEAVAALATGDLYDRYGGRVLLAVPIIVAAVPFLVFAPDLTPVLGGIVLWGLATGIQDSTIKAFVADLVPSRRRATAYGVFAAVQGVGAVAGGGLAGALATSHPGPLAVGIGALQVCSFGILLKLTRSTAGS